jgi:hypothetical protein
VSVDEAAPHWNDGYPVSATSSRSRLAAIEIQNFRLSREGWERELAAVSPLRPFKRSLPYGQQAGTQHSFVAHIDLRASAATECSKP